MSGKPWADPRKPLDERLIAAEVAIANVDTGAERRAIMRDLVDGERERAARVADESDGPFCTYEEWGEEMARAIRALKADAPAG